MTFKPVYEPKNSKMGIVAFFSGGGSSFRAINESPEAGKDYEVVAAFTDTPNCKAAHYALDNGIPLVAHDIKRFYKARGKPLKDMGVRAEFDEWTVDSINDLTGRYGVEADVVMLSGYMRLLTKPVLNRWSNRIFNVHPADLSILDENGKRKYRGDNAVYDAIKAGEKETCSTIHIVNERADEGPIVVYSKRLPVPALKYEERMDDVTLRNFASQHQDRMKNECDIPAFRQAMLLVSNGVVELNEKNEVSIHMGQLLKR